MPTLYNFKVRNIEDRLLNLADFEGKVVIIVSVASKCGFTDQYIGLEELCNNYKKDGLVIIGFPCDQFGSQGPGTNKEIQEFCTLNYNVSFPMAAKINGKVFKRYSSAIEPDFLTDDIKRLFLNKDQVDVE